MNSNSFSVKHILIGQRVWKTESENQRWSVSKLTFVRRKSELVSVQYGHLYTMLMLYLSFANIFISSSNGGPHNPKVYKFLPYFDCTYMYVFYPIISTAT